MARLTEDKIRRLRWDATKLTKMGNVPKFQAHTDGEVAGLHIRLYPPKASGQSSKVFYVQYGPDTGRKVYKIDPWGGEWKLEEARTEANRIRKAYHHKGIDPNQIKKKEIQQAKAKLTVKELVGKYLNAHQVPVWSSNYASSNKGHAKKIVKAFGNRLAETLDKEDIRPFFVKIKEETPTQAKLVRGFISRLYDWGMDEEYISEMTNPAILVRSRSKATLSEYQDPPQKERDRVLESDKGEATGLFEMLKDYDPLFTHMVKLYLLLGFRNAELRTTRWEHIDLKNRLIKNVRPKGIGKDPTKAYKAWLCDMAIDSLKALGLGKIATGPIFPAEHNTDESRSNWVYWYKTISKNPRMPLCPDEGHIWIHDFRTTGVTWLEEMRFDNDIRTIFKGGQPQGVTARSYSKGKKEYIHRTCSEAIEDRLHDIEAGNEKAMFEPWRGSLNPTGIEL